MRTHGPWIIEERAERFSGAFVQLYEDRVTQPDGSPGSYATVTLKPGVAVLPVTADGRVHLTRQFRYAIGRDSVEVVSGGIDEGEDPIDTARRELREEAGLLADEWLDLGRVDLDTSIVRCQVHLFVAEVLRATNVQPDATEDIGHFTVSLDAAVGMVIEGEITHSASCVLILKAERHRAKR